MCSPMRDDVMNAPGPGWTAGRSSGEGIAGGRTGGRTTTGGALDVGARGAAFSSHQGVGGALGSRGTTVSGADDVASAAGEGDDDAAGATCARAATGTATITAVASHRTNIVATSLRDCARAGKVTRSCGTNASSSVQSLPMDRERATLAAMFVVGAISLACSTVPYTVTTRYVRTQRALVMPPSGPHATGVMAADRQTTLEVAAEATAGAPVTQTRANGAVGNVVPAVTGRLRVAYGMFDRIEIGTDIEVATGLVARSAATDLRADASARDALVRWGVQVRGIAVGSRRIGLGLGAEAGIGNAPYVGDVTVSSTSTLGGGGVSSSVDQQVLLMPHASGGLFVHGMPVSSVALLGGVLVQTTPVFQGEQIYSRTCTYAAGAALGNCSYTPNPWPAHYGLRPVGTLWASASWSVGHVVFVGQFFANVLADPVVAAIAPFGGTLAVRLAF